MFRVESIVAMLDIRNAGGNVIRLVKSEIIQARSESRTNDSSRNKQE
jgi:hypothetical protein